MSRLTDLISKARGEDPQLGADLEREFRALSSRLPFGLNFERHRPEAVELPQRLVRRGDKVRVLPPRGSTGRGEQRLWLVTKIFKETGQKVAKLERLDARAEQSEAPLDDLVVVAEFRDIIYPGLISTGKVARGGDKPWHTVINGENYHVLKALTWTHRGKVDAIYIDPPYNTGAKDWKYNNDYVEGDDLYRHSKWLAMMERRLLIAKELLNPADSVLIVTIDEKEYLRLGLLLEQTFLEAKIQMISSVIKPGGTSRTKEFSRVEEYLYFVFIGGAELARMNDNMLEDLNEEAGEGLKYDEVSGGLNESDLWEGMVRRGIGVVRAVRPKQFYPIFIDAEAGRIVRAGEILSLEADRSTVKAPEGLTIVWPIKDDGTEGFWQLSPGGLAAAREKGTVRVGSFNKKTGQRRIQYMKAKKAKAVATGLVATLGKDENGVVILDLEKSALVTESTPRTVWNKTSHDASTGGAGLLNKIIPRRKFPFPKSLYAVEDALRFFVTNKPEAVILDFFSGSGTTAHATMRLNKQDGGRRQCISVTNNEVGADEQKALREQDRRPGNPEWEKWGICDYITKPRVEAAITGTTPDGQPIKGDYKFTDEFPLADGFEENAEFFTLTYETPLAVSYQTAFARIAPLLWLRAGSVGRRIEKLPTAGWDVADAYGLLVELDRATDFLKAARKGKALRIAYIVTDDERRFQALARRLPEGVEAIRLYESYLTNFAFANGEDA